MADGHVREAEHGKVRMHDLPGENNFCNFNLDKPKDPETWQFSFDVQKDYVHSSMVDESYQLIGMHVDQATQDRIIRGEYIDFSRLIPKDQVLPADNKRYEMIEMAKHSGYLLLTMKGHPYQILTGGNRHLEFTQTFI